MDREEAEIVYQTIYTNGYKQGMIHGWKAATGKPPDAATRLAIDKATEYVREMLIEEVKGLNALQESGTKG